VGAFQRAWARNSQSLASLVTLAQYLKPEGLHEKFIRELFRDNCFTVLQGTPPPSGGGAAEGAGTNQARAETGERGCQRDQAQETRRECAWTKGLIRLQGNEGGDAHHQSRTAGGTSGKQENNQQRAARFGTLNGREASWTSRLRHVARG
jgi:hypothetical protein